MKDRRTFLKSISAAVAATPFMGWLPKSKEMIPLPLPEEPKTRWGHFVWHYDGEVRKTYVDGKLVKTEAYKDVEHNPKEPIWDKRDNVYYVNWKQV